MLWLFLLPLLACEPAGPHAVPRAVPDAADCAAPAPPAGPWRVFASGLGFPTTYQSTGDALAFDAQGNLWTTIPGNEGRLLELSPVGHQLLQLGLGRPSVYLHNPEGAAVDGQGQVYVTDRYHQVLKLSQEGQLLATWGNAVFGFLSRVGESPQNVALDREGHLYITTDGDVLKLDLSGHVLDRWRMHQGVWATIGEADWVTVDQSNNVYVSDTLGGSVVELSSAGAVLARWGSKGNGRGQFQGPAGVAVDGQGRVYVADGLSRVAALSPCGQLLREWTEPGANPGQFNDPSGVAVDPTGKWLYVADTGNDRIQALSLQGSS